MSDFIFGNERIFTYKERVEAQGILEIIDAIFEHEKITENQTKELIIKLDELKEMGFFFKGDRFGSGRITDINYEEFRYYPVQMSILNSAKILLLLKSIFYQ